MHSSADELISFICRTFQYKTQLKMFTNALMYFASVNDGEEGLIAMAAKGYYFLQRELRLQFC
jgi:hypothetical protein